MPNPTRSPEQLERFRRIVNWAWGVWRANQATATLSPVSQTTMEGQYHEEMAKEEQDTKESGVQVAEEGPGETVIQEQASIEGGGGELQVAELPTGVDIQDQGAIETGATGPQSAEQVSAGVEIQDQGANETGAILQSTEQLPTGADNHEQIESVIVVPFQKMFAGRPVFHKGGPFVATNFLHALELGWQGSVEDKERLYDALVREIAPKGEIAILDHEPYPFLLFTSREDAEWALSSQPAGRCGGILGGQGQSGQSWLHHPHLPYPQLIEYVVVEEMAPLNDLDVARKIWEAMSQFGQVGFFKWIKAPIDDRNPDQREADDEEEAEMNLRPRVLMQYRVFYRSKSAFRTVERAAEMPEALCPAVLKRRFEVQYRSTFARRIVEKPHPPSTTNPIQPHRMRQPMPDCASTVLEALETYAEVVQYTLAEYQRYDWSSLFVNNDENPDSTASEHADVIAVKKAFTEARARDAAALACRSKRKGQDKNGAGNSSKRVRS